MNKIGDKKKLLTVAEKKNLAIRLYQASIPLSDISLTLDVPITILKKWLKHINEIAVTSSNNFNIRSDNKHELSEASCLSLKDICGGRTASSESLHTLSESKLFKKNELGEPLTFLSLSMTLGCYFFIFLAIGILSLLFWGTYTEKLSLTGQVVPLSGEAAVYSQRQGYVAAIHVHENQKVRLGDALFTLSKTASSGEGNEYSLMLSLLKTKRKRLIERMDHNREQFDLEDQLLEIQRQILNIEASIAYKVRAPRDGVVNALALQQGQYVDQEALAMILQPESPQWVIELHVSNRDMALLNLGDNVTIRFDAYPYQKFGLYSGKLLALSRSYEGLSKHAFTGGQVGYKATVSLDKQCIQHRDDCHSLQSGMKVTASIVLAKRSIFEWLFKPLSTVSKA